MKFHYCLEHDRICLACPDCVEKARKESFENGRIVGFEAGLIDKLVERRVEKARRDGYNQAIEDIDKIFGVKKKGQLPTNKFVGLSESL